MNFSLSRGIHEHNNYAVSFSPKIYWSREEYLKQFHDMTILDPPRAVNFTIEAGFVNIITMHTVNSNMSPSKVSEPGGEGGLGRLSPPPHFFWQS